MNSKIFFLVSLGCFTLSACIKEQASKFMAEGYVYEYGTRKPLSDIPVVMSECIFTGSRCSYNTISTTRTDASGHYKISGRPMKGSINIAVQFNDKTYGTPEINNLPLGKIFYHDFFVELAAYVSVRFIVQTQNRNFVSVNVRTGLYGGTGEVVRNPPTVLDTALRFRFALNESVSLFVLLRNENGGSIYSDSLLYTKNLGTLSRDTSLLWTVP